MKEGGWRVPPALVFAPQGAQPLGSCRMPTVTCLGAATALAGPVGPRSLLPAGGGGVQAAARGISKPRLRTDHLLKGRYLRPGRIPRRGPVYHRGLVDKL